MKSKKVKNGRLTEVSLIIFIIFKMGFEKSVFASINNI